MYILRRALLHKYINFVKKKNCIPVGRNLEDLRELGFELFC
jgi:hypothetical protein